MVQLMAKEGRKIKGTPPMDLVGNYIMPDRDAASNYFIETFDIGECEKYIKRKREEGLKGFGMLHIFAAAYVRTISQRPGINRFIRGQKRYARNGVEISMTIKKSLTLDAPETCIKVFADPADTAEDIYRKMNALVSENKDTETENGMDAIVNVLRYIPGVFLKFTVWLLKLLDYFGLLPRALTKESPFHASIFITNMASLGIKPVFHHLYDFGTLPVFMGIGAKYEKNELDADGNVVTKRCMDMSIVCDERICDGHYYASAFKYLRGVMKKPDVLDNPPEKVVEDMK